MRQMFSKNQLINLIKENGGASGFSTFEEFKEALDNNPDKAFMFYEYENDYLWVLMYNTESQTYYGTQYDLFDVKYTIGDWVYEEDKFVSDGGEERKLIYESFFSLTEFKIPFNSSILIDYNDMTELQKSQFNNLKYNFDKVTKIAIKYQWDDEEILIVTKPIKTKASYTDEKNSFYLCLDFSWDGLTGQISIGTLGDGSLHLSSVQ